MRPRVPFQDRDALGDFANLSIAGAALLLAAVIGAAIAVITAGSQTLRPSLASGNQPTLTSATPSVTTVLASATASAALVAPQVATPPPVAGQPLGAISTIPTVSPTTVTTAVAPTPTPAVSSTPTTQPTATAAQAWADVEPELARVWGSDTPRTVALLNDFVGRFGDYPPAREKLYAALIASAVELALAGDTDSADQRFEQAQALIPERGEAAATALALTPTPSPTPEDNAPV
jgi:hypothetical protein